MTVYDAGEITKHNKEDDLWMVIHGGVYNLTKFLKEHPGGEEVLIKLAGTDGTKCFDDNGHTGEAIKLRETFRIGDATGDVPIGVSSKPESKEATTDDDDWEYEPPKYETSPWLPVMIAVGAAVYAGIFYYLYL